MDKRIELKHQKFAARIQRQFSKDKFWIARMSVVIVSVAYLVSRICWLLLLLELDREVISQFVSDTLVVLTITVFVIVAFFYIVHISETDADMFNEWLPFMKQARIVLYALSLAGIVVDILAGAERTILIWGGISQNIQYLFYLSWLSISVCLLDIVKAVGVGSFLYWISIPNQKSESCEL